MPKILMPYTVHLDHTLRVTPLNTLFSKGDSAAHRFELTILRSGVQEELTGCKVLCKFYRMADSTVVSVPGSVEDEKAVAVLDAACYDYIGRFALTISIQNGEEETTVFYGDGYMHGQSADTSISGDYIIYDINTLLEKISEIDAATQAANTAAINANTSASNANTATTNANTATGKANTAASAANTAATNANTAKDAANAAAVKINGMTVSADPVSTGTATAALSTVDGHYHLALGLPKGDTGATPQISVQVETGAAGSEAQVSVSGTAENPVIHLTIPRGDVGAIENLTINGKPVESGTIMLKAEDVFARPDTWMPTADDVGALEKGGTAENSIKLNGQAAGYYATASALKDLTYRVDDLTGPNAVTNTYSTPEMYGAAGDGETDDTQALQSAIDSGRDVLLVGRYKVGEVKLAPYVTMTGAPGGRIVDGKVMMCPHSAIVGVVFEVTSGNTNNCIIDIGTYDATGVAESGGDDRYTIRDVKVVTNFAVKSNLDFAYIHVGDGELTNLFGVRITNVSIDGRLGKVFHFKAHLKEGNIVDNGNGVWVNTVSIDNVWCGVPEYIVYTDYDDPNNLKSQLDTPLRIGELFMNNVTGEYSQYAKNDVYIGFPSTISAMDVGFVDKGYTRDGNDPATAMYNIVQQPWYNNSKTIIRTDCMDERFFSYANLANQNIAYINGSYTVGEDTLYDTFLHDLSNNAYGIISSRTTDAPIDPRNMTLNLVKNVNDSRTLMGVGLKHRMVFRSNAEDSGTKFSLYFRSRPAVEYNDRVGCLYSDLYMPYGVSKGQLGDAYVPVIGSMVFNSATGKPMWYTGEKWVYADGTDADFS